MRILLLLLMMVYGTTISAQIYSGIGIDYSIGWSSDKIIENYYNGILIFKKPINTDLSILGSFGYRNYKSKVNRVTKDSDFDRFFKQTYPEKKLATSYYITNSSVYSFNYIPVSMGIEFKLTTFARIQYNFEANWFIAANSTIKSYMQYGKKSITVLPITHDLSVHFHIHGSGLFLGVSTLPTFIRKDLVYNYKFMNDINLKAADSYMFHVGARQNFAGAKRKRKVI